jgi:hypothetical protein
VPPERPGQRLHQRPSRRASSVICRASAASQMCAMQPASVAD